MQFSTLLIATVAAALPAFASPTPVAKPAPDATRPELAKRTTHFGQGTYYFQGGAAGSCGTVHQDSDLIIALPLSWNGNNQYCGRLVQVTDTNNGNTITVTVADQCPGCVNDNIDFSVGAASRLDPNYENDGVWPISWHFCNVNGQC